MWSKWEVKLASTKECVNNQHHSLKVNTIIYTDTATVSHNSDLEEDGTGGTNIEHTCLDVCMDMPSVQPKKAPTSFLPLGNWHTSIVSLKGI